MSEKRCPVEWFDEKEDQLAETIKRLNDQVLENAKLRQALLESQAEVARLKDWADHCEKLRKVAEGWEKQRNKELRESQAEVEMETIKRKQAEQNYQNVADRVALLDTLLAKARAEVERLSNRWRQIEEAPKIEGLRILGFSEGWGFDIFVFTKGDWRIFSDEQKEYRPNKFTPIPDFKGEI